MIFASVRTSSTVQAELKIASEPSIAMTGALRLIFPLISNSLNFGTETKRYRVRFTT